MQISDVPCLCCPLLLSLWLGAGATDGPWLVPSSSFKQQAWQKNLRGQLMVVMKAQQMAKPKRCKDLSPKMKTSKGMCTHCTTHNIGFQKGLHTTNVAHACAVNALRWAYCGCCRQHSHKQEEQRSKQQDRLVADAALRHTHCVAKELQWQEVGVKLYGRQTIPCKWPPVAGVPCAHQHDSVCAKAAVVDEYFEQLQNLHRRIFTCPCCLQRTVHHGTPESGVHHNSGEPALCRNCYQYPQGFQAVLAAELDMRPEREPDPTKKAAKLEWALLLHKHGRLLPMEECLLSPVLCFVKVRSAPLSHCPCLLLGGRW